MSADHVKSLVCTSTLKQISTMKIPINMFSYSEPNGMEIKMRKFKWEENLGKQAKDCG